MKNKIKNKCLTTNYATCTIYEKDVPTYSSLSGQDCIDLEQTTEDLYNLTTDVREQIDLTDLGNDCLTYIRDAENRTVVKNVLLKYEEEICKLKLKIEEINNTSICDRLIGDCVDTTGLVDPCGDPIETYGQLLQFLTSKHNI